MSRIHFVFRPSDHVVSTSTCNSSTQSPEKNGVCSCLIAGFPRLSGWGKVFLLALVCGLMFLTSAKSALARQGRERRPELTLSASTLSFGSVTVNSPATGSVTLTSSGTSAVTVHSASITGAGFTIVSGSLPVTLSPSQSVTLQLRFLPTAVGTDTGQLTISSNSASGSTATTVMRPRVARRRWRVIFERWGAEKFQQNGF